MPQQLSSAIEDYLQAVFRIEQQKRFARVRDIADALGVAKSSATAALKTLSEKGLVNYVPYEPVTLSPQGHKQAERIVLRHRIIVDFLENVLGIAPERADSIACGMEHGIDRDALERLVCFLAFVKRYSSGEEDWLGQFRHFVEEGADGKTCRECVQAYMKAARQAK